MYTEHVPVTSTGTFGGYQVIVMPSQDLPTTLEATKHIDDFNEPKFPIDPNEGQMNFSKLVVVNSFAKKNAVKRDTRAQLICTNCDFKCVTPVLMKLHHKTIHANNAQCSMPEEYKTEVCSECKVSFLTKYEILFNLEYLFETKHE